MSIRTIFMRHGESAYNVLGLCNDDPAVAVPLTEVGRRQAEQAAERLAASPIDLLLVSQLPRAGETAAIVNHRRCLPTRVDARLNDRRTGFEGKPIAEYLAARDADPDNFCAAGGEPYTALKRRVLAFLDDLAGFPERHVLVVSHHEVLQVVQWHFSGLSDAATRRLWIDNCGTFEVDHQRG